MLKRVGGFAYAAFVVGALFGTVSRLVGSSAYLPTLLISFTPYLTLVYAVVLVIGVGIALRAGAGRWLRAAIGACALGLILHLAWLMPSLVRDDDQGGDQARGTAVRVLTINVKKGRANPDSLERVIENASPDILVLLEVRPPLVAGVDDLIPDGLKRVAGSGFRIDTQVFSRFDSPGAEELGLSLGGWRTRLMIGGRTVETFAAHPFSPLTDIDAWRTDHDRLRDAVAGSEGPALVIGDLNATVDHPPLRRLDDLGVRDAAGLAGVGWRPTYPSDGALPSLLAIDHVLVRGDWVVQDVTTVSVVGTDHRAVQADLVLRAAAG